MRTAFPEIIDVVRVTEFYVRYVCIAGKTARKRELTKVNECFACEVAGVPVTMYGVGANYEYGTRLRKWLRTSRNKYNNRNQTA